MADSRTGDMRDVYELKISGQTISQGFNRFVVETTEFSKVKDKTIVTTNGRNVAVRSRDLHTGIDGLSLVRVPQQ